MIKYRVFNFHILSLPNQLFDTARKCDICKFKFFIPILFSANMICPSMWVGTSLGTVAVIALSVPPSGDRTSQPVLSNTTGKHVELKVFFSLDVSRYV